MRSFRTLAAEICEEAQTGEGNLQGMECADSSACGGLDQYRSTAIVSLVAPTKAGSVQCACETWTMDFVHDQLTVGTEIRMFIIVGAYSRFSRSSAPIQLSRGIRHWRAGARLRKHRRSDTIHADRGSEFVYRDADLWAYTCGVTLDFSRSGKSPDKASIGAFNGISRRNSELRMITHG